MKRKLFSILIFFILLATVNSAIYAYNLNIKAEPVEDETLGDGVWIEFFTLVKASGMSKTLSSTAYTEYSNYIDNRTDGNGNRVALGGSVANYDVIGVILHTEPLSSYDQLAENWTPGDFYKKWTWSNAKNEEDGTQCYNKAIAFNNYYDAYNNYIDLANINDYYSNATGKKATVRKESSEGKILKTYYFGVNHFKIDVKIFNTNYVLFRYRIDISDLIADEEKFSKNVTKNKDGSYTTYVSLITKFAGKYTCETAWDFYNSLSDHMLGYAWLAGVKGINGNNQYDRGASAINDYDNKLTFKFKKKVELESEVVHQVRGTETLLPISYPPTASSESEPGHDWDKLGKTAVYKKEDSNAEHAFYDLLKVNNAKSWTCTVQRESYTPENSEDTYDYMKIIGVEFYDKDGKMLNKKTIEVSGDSYQIKEDDIHNNYPTCKKVKIIFYYSLNRKNIYVNYSKKVGKSLSVLYIAPKYDICDCERSGYFDFLHIYLHDDSPIELFAATVEKKNTGKSPIYEKYELRVNSNTKNDKAILLYRGDEFEHDGVQYKYVGLKYVTGPKGESYDALWEKLLKEGTAKEGKEPPCYIREQMDKDRAVLISFMYKPNRPDEIKLEVVHRTKGGKTLPIAQEGHDTYYNYNGNSDRPEKEGDEKRAEYRIITKEGRESVYTKVNEQGKEYIDEEADNKKYTYMKQAIVEFYKDYNSDYPDITRRLDDVNDAEFTIEDCLKEGYTKVRITFYYKSTDPTEPDREGEVCSTLSFRSLEPGLANIEYGCMYNTDSKYYYGCEDNRPENEEKLEYITVPTNTEIEAELTTTLYKIEPDILQTVTLAKASEVLVLRQYDYSEAKTEVVSVVYDEKGNEHKVDCSGGYVSGGKFHCRGIWEDDYHRISPDENGNCKSGTDSNGTHYSSSGDTCYASNFLGYEPVEHTYTVMTADVRDMDQSKNQKREKELKIGLKNGADPVLGVNGIEDRGCMWICTKVTCGECRIFILFNKKICSCI